MGGVASTDFPKEGRALLPAGSIRGRCAEGAEESAPLPSETRFMIGRFFCVRFGVHNVADLCRSSRPWAWDEDEKTAVCFYVLCVDEVVLALGS